ncbi:hypothetical protein [Falsirhodobacter deserti]|uniref:hypothetical protein n=1 Tax=Falsirhodobacter deserti TaxID=1365611 RepID=UPI000FE2F161|nr:hypothetical protein [Falsirhodobacter deserti]
MQDELLRQAGGAFIVVTHSVEEALVLGDRILLMASDRSMRTITPRLSGVGGGRRRDPAFYTRLATLSDDLRAAAM